jgi:hypothetical protein
LFPDKENLDAETATRLEGWILPVAGPDCIPLYRFTGSLQEQKSLCTDSVNGLTWKAVLEEIAQRYAYESAIG